jgi:hypothetical protein
LLQDDVKLSKMLIALDVTGTLQITIYQFVLAAITHTSVIVAQDRGMPDNQTSSEIIDIPD